MFPDDVSFFPAQGPEDLFLSYLKGGKSMVPLGKTLLSPPTKSVGSNGSSSWYLEAESESELRCSILKIRVGKKM